MRTIGRLLGTVLAAVSIVRFSHADEFTVLPGDHICIVGNTLADRMQHDGWFETALFKRFPKHELVIRNLGFSGDEIFLQLRSEGFGSQDDHLRFNRADVIIAFFGYNESFAGEEGLPDFTARLEQTVAHWKSQNYNGESPPRVVLCSPIAHEDLNDPHLPNGQVNNANLEIYTQAMQSVAQDQDVTFVDLFSASQKQYVDQSVPLTINGVHLNEVGNCLIAIELERSLFGDTQLAGGVSTSDAVLKAVRDKNFYWFNRYRTTDGYSIFGGRADLAFVEGQSNRDVMQREMTILDQLTALRDQAIWRIAQGETSRIDESATEQRIPVITNKPGPGPGGAHIALDERQSLEKIRVASGFRVELFASEREFPQLVNPVQMSFDTRGRLWVATWPTYPHWEPKTPMNDSLLILEDINGDGRADNCKTFAGDLHNPTGFEFYNGGVLVANAPDLIFLKDTDGDDVADVRERVLHGLDSADTHHTANSFVYDPGGALYFQEGTFHHTQVETPYGPTVRSANAAVFRFEPRTFKFEVYVPFGFANPHGHVFDRWGQDIIHDGTSSVPYHGSLISGYLPFPQKHPSPPAVYEQRTRPCPATEIISSRHFPPEMQGNLLVGNVIGLQGLLNYRIERDSASLRGTEVEPLFSSSDESFRPVDFEIGPDGTLYFLDWYNPIIGHMQHNLRDPSRDKSHGRVYRVIANDRPLLTPVPVAGEPIEKLLDLLKEPEDRVRYRVKIELQSRPADQVIAATKKWLSNLNSEDADFEHHRLEALWLHQWLDHVDVSLLDEVFQSKEPLARAAATRVLCAWRDRIEDVLPRLKKLANDADPLVRLEAVRAASYLKSPQAVDVALIANQQSTDKYLNYVIHETIKGLKSYWSLAIVEAQPLSLTNPESLELLLSYLDAADLIKAPGERAVYVELLMREGIPEQHRRRALTGLASAEASPPTKILLDALSGLDSIDHLIAHLPGEDGVIFDLIRFLSEQPKSDLAKVRDQLVQLSLKSRRGIIRQMGFVALISADGDPKPAWELAMANPAAMIDLVTAVPLILDPEHRAQLFEPLQTLVTAFPESLAQNRDAPPATVGQFVRIELPGKNRVLTLAEVEVHSTGRNVAPQGTATQKNTAYGAEASRALDGNRSGVFADNGQTHSEDPTDAPWWELDLQKPTAIDSISIFNRTEEKFAERLSGFTLKILDENRKVVAQLNDVAAPASMETYHFPGRDPVAAIRHAAMNALASVRGNEAQTVALLLNSLDDDNDRVAAISGLQKIAPSDWPADAAESLVEKLLAYIQSVPESRRTSPNVLDALQLADAAAGKLSADQAPLVRRQLSQLGVRVIRLSTVPHRMIYDQEIIVVQAGKPVELIFENSDIMPHNVVITEMGALAEVGNLAESTATDPDAARRDYVPASNKVLVASPLVAPQSIRKLSFQAPTQIGVYPLVCTYPGHWRTMYAAMYVVEDLAEYSIQPDEYLSNHPLPIHDELLANRRPRTSWTLADLEPRIQSISAPSFENGRRMFQVANCMACHRLDGQGLQFGADLTKLDPKLTPTEVLRAVVEPSFEINKDYQSYKFEMIDGKSYAGIIVGETQKEIRVVENPLVTVEPLVLDKDDVDVQTKSTKSLMPEGLLDRLSQHEVMDLVAFVLARGDRNHPLYQSGSNH